MYSTLSRCLRLTPSARWTTYWQRRISATYRMVFTRRSTRIPSRRFGSGSTPSARKRVLITEGESPRTKRKNDNGQGAYRGSAAFGQAKGGVRRGQAHGSV